MAQRRAVCLALSAFVAAVAAAVSGVTPAAGVQPSTAPSGPFLSWELTPTGSVDQFRGLAAVSGRIAWASGETGTVLRTLDGGATWQDVSPSAAAGLQLRDIEAWDARHAVALSIGNGEDSRIYSTLNGGRTWTERFRNEDPDAFYDCMAFSASGRGLALSDPVDGFFRLALSRDFGQTWQVQSTQGMPAARAEEFGFAASGTCIVSGTYRNFWFISGGNDFPRLFHSTDGGRTWDANDMPIIGGASAGIFSVDFRAPNEGVMVGGDYELPDLRDGASAYLNDVLGVWSGSRPSVFGYRSGVSFLPHTPATTVAVGPTGSDYSLNGGKSWVNFDDGAFDGVQCASTGTCWASGPDGRIAKLLHGDPNQP